MKTTKQNDGPQSEAQPETKSQQGRDSRFWEHWERPWEPVPEDVVEEWADEELDKPLTSRAFLIGCAMVARSISLVSPSPEEFLREAQYRFAMDWARGKMRVEK
jgi:hypothetical protein